MPRLMLSMACGKLPEQPPAPPMFTPDAVAAGPGLLTRATSSGSDVVLKVVSRGLGAVLGYAFTLRYEGITPMCDATVPEAVGPIAFGEALYLVKPSSGA